jgi:hypothetical protein
LLGDEVKIKKRRAKNAVQLRKNIRDNFINREREKVVAEAIGPDIEKRLENFPTLCKNLYDSSINVVYDSLHQIKKILSVGIFLNLFFKFCLEKRPPIQYVLAMGILPRLCEFLLPGFPPKIQFEACWAITNIASGSSEQTQAVYKCGAVPHIVNLVRSENLDVREQAIWALGY